MAHSAPYKVLDVIRYTMAAGLSVTGIIAERDERGALIMFEDGKNGVEFARYNTTGLYKFAVIG